MNQSSPGLILQEPIPQVGAILNLDTLLTSFDRDDTLYFGSKHWKLDGSCVLVGHNRVLTIRHILQKHSPSAVFIPYEGIFRIPDGLEWEDGPKGDNLVMAGLERKDGPVRHLRPLSHEKILGWRKHNASAIVCGYGQWPKTPFRELRGLQQRYSVDLGAPRASSGLAWEGYDNLDICWSSAENGSKVLGNANSGGPMLRRQDDRQRSGLDAETTYSIIGINRERKGDQQIGSWIGHKRHRWLRRQQKAAGSVPYGEPLSTSYHPLSVEKDGGVTVQLGAPEQASQVKATLNATEGLRLQMTLESAADSGKIFERTRDCNRASGQFLYREKALATGTRRVAICVAPVARAPARVESVIAQLCVMFV